jgi:hypothetical protein
MVGFADWVLLRCSGSASSWFLDSYYKNPTSLLYAAENKFD